MRGLHRGAAAIMGRLAVLVAAVLAAGASAQLVSCPPDAFEPNDTPQMAHTLPVSQTNPRLAVAATACIGNSDWYAIDLCAGCRAFVNVYFFQEQGDLDLVFYGPDGVPGNASVSETDHEAVAYTNTNSNSARHLFHIYHFEDGSTGTGAGAVDYGLHIDILTPATTPATTPGSTTPTPSSSSSSSFSEFPSTLPSCANDEYEPNDVWYNATQLPSLPQQTISAVACPYDSDYYTYELCANCTTNVTVAFDQDPGDVPYLGLYHGFGNASTVRLNDRTFYMTYTVPPHVGGMGMYLFVYTSLWVSVNYEVHIAASQTPPTFTEPPVLDSFELVFMGGWPFNNGPQRRFSTAFENEAIIAVHVSPLPDGTPLACASLCLEEPMCAGVYMDVLDNDDRRCILLNDLGTEEGVIDEAPSFSFRRIFATAPSTTSATTTAPATSITALPSTATTGPSFLEPPMVAGFDLFFVGDWPFNNGSALRFSTAFDSRAIISVHSTPDPEEADPQGCADLCLDDPMCEGVFMWQLASGERRCVLLNDLGTEEGIPTNTASFSFRRLDPSTTTTTTTEPVIVRPFLRELDGYSVAFKGRVKGSRDPRRFSTAFDASATLVSLDNIDPELCALQCNMTSECEGIFAWAVSASLHRCVLLSDLGTEEGVGTSTYSWSHAKQRSDAIETPDGYALTHLGDVPENTGQALRFSTAFDASERVDSFFDVGPAVCASACDANLACLGFFYWVVSESQTRCYLLSSLGSPVPTSSASYSFSRDPPPTFTAPEGYSVEHRGDTFDNPSGPYRRFSTAFDSSYRLDTLTTTSRDDGAACAAQCDATEGCLGFFYWLRSPNDYVCYLLSNLGTGSGVATSTTSWSVAKEGSAPTLSGYELSFEGVTATNSGEARRFSTAFNAGVRLASMANVGLQTCADACGESVLCLGFFHWTKSATASVCWLLSDTGTVVGVETGTNSYSFAKLP